MTIGIQNQPVNDPCVNYFIQVVVSLNGEIVNSYTLLQQGGLCTNNPVDCGGSSFLVTNDQELPIIYNTVSLEDKKVLEQRDSQQYYVFDMYGQLLLSKKERPLISELQSMNFVSGLYLLVTTDGRNIIDSQKIILQNIK